MSNTNKMKELFLIIFLLTACNSYSQTTKFFIKSNLTMEGGDTRPIQGSVAYFVSQFDNKVKAIYPCSVITDESDIGALLQHERELELLDANKERGLQSISNALNCDYMIVYSLTIVGSIFAMQAYIVPYSNNKKILTPIILADAHGPYSEKSGGPIFDACDNIAEKLVSGLKQLEICVFKGPVNLHITGSTNSKKTEEYTVYCNQKDGKYRKVVTIDKHTDNIWKLERIGKNYSNGKNSLIKSTGENSYSASEEHTVEEQSDCYKCASGPEGFRSSKEKITTTSEASVVSNQSSVGGIAKDSAIVLVQFREDNTYTINVVAVAKKVPVKVKTESHAQGVCENFDTAAVTVDKNTELAIELTFGPFPGTSADKALVQKQTISKVDPVTEEKTNLTIDFNLKRDK